MNDLNRYRVEITIPVWMYEDDDYMRTLDTNLQEHIIGRLAEDLDTGAVSFMDVKHWRIVLDNPTFEFGEGDPWVDLDPDIPIDYYPTEKR